MMTTATPDQHVLVRPDLLRRVGAAPAIVALAAFIVACGGDDGRRASGGASDRDAGSGEFCITSANCPSGEFCEDNLCTPIERTEPDADTGGADAGGGDDDVGSDAPTPDTGGDGGAGADEDWITWGTVGSLDGEPKSEGGFALCDAGDVNTEDLGTFSDNEIPSSEWGDEPVADEVARCGDDLETLSWRLMNCERMSRELEPLSCDLRLVWLGRMHSEDMFLRGFFDHVNPDGDSPFDRMDDSGIGYRFAGENIATYPSSEQAHLAWMDSDGHRNNILTPQYSHGAIGIHDPGRRLLLTQLFIQP